MAEQTIYLQPMGRVEPHVLGALIQRVEEAFGLPVHHLSAVPVPDHALNLQRGQYHSTVLLDVLLRRVPGDAVRVLGITDADLFVPQLNFVFGEATIDGRVGIVSLRRLYPEFYGYAENQALFIQRAAKESIHELGHTFGLRHCPDPVCVMCFSNNIDDTDSKSARFCLQCARELVLKLNPIHAAA